jgi:hypothetical protein
MSSCDYSGVFVLGTFVALIIYYIVQVITIIIQERIQNNLK